MDCRIRDKYASPRTTSVPISSSGILLDPFSLWMSRQRSECVQRLIRRLDPGSCLVYWVHRPEDDVNDQTVHLFVVLDPGKRPEKMNVSVCNVCNPSIGPFLIYPFR